MSKMNVKKGDQVVVLSGKDKGKQGEVLVAKPAEGKKVRICKKCGAEF